MNNFSKLLLACDRIFDRYSLHLGIASVAMMPVKLIFTFIALVPLIVLWIIKSRNQFANIIKENRWFLVPFIFFICSVSISCLFGLDPIRGLKALPSLIFFSFSVLVFKELASKHGIPIFIYSLALGQACAALHSVLDSAFPNTLPRIFLGAVTESGQLALTIMSVCGLIIFLTKEKIAPPAPEKKTTGNAGLYILSFIITCTLVAVAFMPSFGVTPIWVSFASMLIFAILAFYSMLGSRMLNNQSFFSKEAYPAIHFLLLSVIFPLLIAAVIINLKRGPWAGLLVAGSLILFVFEKRLIIPLLTLAFCTFVFIQPVRTRLTQSSQDFFIAGGRSIIWEIGSELAMRYPLGVGYKNSPFLQKFSPEIPPELKHFHNNALNIVVENGWISLALFVWWIFVLLKFAFTFPRKIPQYPLAIGLGCALLAWQVAGIVEYNFGDAEVLQIAFVVMGLLTACKKGSD